MGAESRGRGETGAWPAGRREGVEAQLVLGARRSVSLVLLLSSGSLQDDARSFRTQCVLFHIKLHMVSTDNGVKLWKLLRKGQELLFIFLKRL